MNIRGPFVLAVVLGMTALSAQAQLFGGDDDARRAILDLRQRFDVQRKDVDSLRQVLDLVRQELQGLRQELQVSKQESQALRQETQTLRQGLDAARQYTDVAGSETQKGIARAAEDTAVLRRSLLDLQNQIQSVRADLASQRGVNEQLARDLAEAQRRQKDMAQATQDRFQDIVQATEERFRQFEPVKVNVDGLEFFAEPSEKRSFEAAVEVLKKGDFAAAQGVFADFLSRYPQSGYYSSGLFWLGNAQYATKDYKEAMINFRALMTRSPDHVRAPEAALSVANCQIELKDVKGARKTLEDLLKAYPKSEAAPTARDRLERFRQFEPVKVNVDGLEFFAEPSEKRSFEAAVEVLKKGDFAAAQGVFADFLSRYPQSGYYSSGLFWLGNAQYATKDYKEAMINFRALMTRSPDHVRAPEAALSVANCQIELKDVKGARKTLDDLLKAYPKSEAAPTARDRLARLK